MIVLEQDSGHADIRLTAVELSMVNNALNEITNGVWIADGEFETRLGQARSKFRELLDQINTTTPRSLG